MRGKKLTKSITQYIHFKRRLRNRYGLRLNSKAAKEVLTLIQEGKASFIQRVSNTRTTWEIPLRLLPTLTQLNPLTRVEKITVAYDNSRKQLATAGEILKKPNPYRGEPPTDQVPTFLPIKKRREIERKLKGEK